MLEYITIVDRAQLYHISINFPLWDEIFSEERLFMCLRNKFNHHIYVSDLLIVLISNKGPFKYYVIKEVGGWSKKMAIFDL